MSTELLDPEAEIRMSPEMVEVATTYLQCNDINETAEQLKIEREEVVYYLNKPETKRFIDTVYLDQGYLNRHKLQAAFSDIINKKLEELDESEMGSNKDIADLLMMAHKMGMDTRRESVEVAPKTVTNVQQNNYNNDLGDNYAALLQKLIDVQ